MQGFRILRDPILKWYRPVFIANEDALLMAASKHLTGCLAMAVPARRRGY